MDATGPAPVAAPVRPEFSGQVNPMVKLLARGWLFTLLTLGIYRFWLISDARRYLWSHTRIGGDVLEYTGRGRELLIGFLIALTLTVPFYVVVALLSLAGPGGELAGGLAFLVGFWCLVQFAIYRARRYRLTRTLFRGIRLGLGGSATNYMLRSVMWTLLSLLTLGWAYSWQVAALERYAISNSWFGDLKAEFTGTGAGLFARLVWLQLIALLPFQIALINLLQSTDYSRLSGLLDPALDDGTPAHSGLPFSDAALGMLAGSVAWLVLTGILLYPVYRAILFRWRANGVRLGSMTVASDLRGRQVYKLYLKLLLATFILGIVLSMLAGALVALGSAAFGGEDAARLLENLETLISLAGIAAFVLAYAVAIIGYYVVYQVIVWMGFWRVAVGSLQLSDIAVLDRARIGQEESSALGEGITDALDFGGF